MSTAGFHGAPLMKAACFGTAATSLFLPAGAKALLMLDLPRVLSGGEVWRLATRHLAFESMGETCVGLILLYRFRQFERFYGSGKFGAFVLVVGSLATSLEAAGALVLSSGTPWAPASGPYALIFASTALCVTRRCGRVDAAAHYGTTAKASPECAIRVTPRFFSHPLTALRPPCAAGGGWLRARRRSTFDGGSCPSTPARVFFLGGGVGVVGMMRSAARRAAHAAARALPIKPKPKLNQRRGCRHDGNGSCGSKEREN